MEIQYNGLKLVKDGTVICENNREIHFILDEGSCVIIQAVYNSDNSILRINGGILHPLVVFCTDSGIYHKGNMYFL
jgi:hypothetical protein